MEKQIVLVNTVEYGSVDEDVGIEREEVSEEEDPSEEEPFEEDPNEEEPFEEDPVEEEPNEVDSYKVEPDEEEPTEEPCEEVQDEEDPDEEPFEEEPEEEEEEEEPMEDPEEEASERSSRQQSHNNNDNNNNNNEETPQFNSAKMTLSSDTISVFKRVSELSSIQNSSSEIVIAPQKPAITRITSKKRRNKWVAKDEASELAEGGCKMSSKKMKTKSGANSNSHHVKEIDDSKLFVGFFPQYVDETKLIELFCPFGPITEVKVMREAGTGLSKGFGFVKYTNYIDAAKAVVQMSGYKIGGKMLTVRIAGIFPSHSGPAVTLQSYPAPASRLGHPESRPPESVASFPYSTSLQISSNSFSGQSLACAGSSSRASTSNNPLFSGDFVSPNEVGQSPGILKGNNSQTKKSKKGKCFFCGKNGHRKLECWNYLVMKEGGATSEKKPM